MAKCKDRTRTMKRWLRMSQNCATILQVNSEAGVGVVARHEGPPRHPTHALVGPPSVAGQVP